MSLENASSVGELIKFRDVIGADIRPVFIKKFERMVPEFFRHLGAASFQGGDRPALAC